MSYADLSATVTKQGGRVSDPPTLEEIVEETKQKRITQIDGRDLLRCRITEEQCGVEIFTVSREEGAKYVREKHFSADFGGRNFCSELETYFGSHFTESVTFSQIFLDYYWMPAIWTEAKWGKQFFSRTLPTVARREILSRPASTLIGASGLLDGAIIIPFCVHSFREVIANWDNLRRFYNLSFLRKGVGLRGIAVWKGTQKLNAEQMRKLKKKCDGDCDLCPHLLILLSVKIISS